MSSEPPGPRSDMAAAVSGESAARGPSDADTAQEAGGGTDTLDALQALERMLEQRHGLAGGEAPRAHGGRAGAPSAPQESDGQLRIPLLDEVVRPGSAPPPASLPPASTRLSPVAQRLFERLASEIDVIVQSGVDEALRTAAKTIRARIKQHVSIVLPEILDELAHEDDEQHGR